MTPPLSANQLFFVRALGLNARAVLGQRRWSDVVPTLRGIWVRSTYSQAVAWERVEAMVRVAWEEAVGPAAGDALVVRCNDPAGEGRRRSDAAACHLYLTQLPGRQDEGAASIPVSPRVWFD